MPKADQQTIERKKTLAKRASTGVRYNTSRDTFTIHVKTSTGEFQGGSFETVEDAEAALAAYHASVEASAKEAKTRGEPRWADRPLKAKLADLKATLIERVTNPHPAEALIQLCAKIADEQSMLVDRITLDDFRRLVEDAEPELFDKLPTDFRVGQVMQSQEIENQYGFWRLEKREGRQPIIVFTEQREPIFEGMDGYICDLGPRVAELIQAPTREALRARHLSHAADTVAKVGTVHERMTLWDFRKLCVDANPELFAAMPEDFGAMMRDNAEFFGTWRIEKRPKHETEGADDPSPWIYFTL